MSPPPGVSVSTIAATATATTGCHVLRFEGYQLIKRMHSGGEHVVSSAFEAAGHSWRILCYPNGSYCDSEYISLYLMLADADVAAGGVRAEFKFSLLRRRGRPRSKSLAATFKAGQTTWGFEWFMRRGRLESRRSGFLEDDCLAVRCDITVLGKPGMTVKASEVQARDLEMLGIVCDCTDDLCKRHHVGRTPTEPRKSFLNFVCFRSSK